MVDVGGKVPTVRTATAGGTVMLSGEVVALLRRGEIAKGNVLAAAKTAGILAAKRTPELIPLCHPLLLEHIDLEFELGDDRVEINSVDCNPLELRPMALMLLEMTKEIEP